MDAAALNTSADSGSPVRAGYRRSEVAVPVLVEREKVRFVSGDTECAAWHAALGRQA